MGELNVVMKSCPDISDRFLMTKDALGDYTGSAGEYYDKNMEVLDKFLKNEATTDETEWKYSARNLSVAVLDAVALIVFWNFQEDPTWGYPVSMGIITCAILSGIASLAVAIRNRNAYWAMRRLVDLYEEGKLSLTEQSIVYQVGAQFMAKHGKEAWKQDDGMFVVQKTLLEIVNSEEITALDLVGYSTEYRVALIRARGAEKDSILPFASCDLVREDREGLYVSVHPEWSVLRVPEGFYVPDINILDLSVSIADDQLKVSLSFQFIEQNLPGKTSPAV
jgi:hypothetical protein